FTLLYFTLLYFTLLYFTCPLYAQDSPAWIIHTDVFFPQDEYISALGTGDSIQASREDAISQLVLYFNSKVTVNNTSSLSMREMDDFVDKDRNVYSEVSVFSQAELPTLSFTESYFHQQSGKWYICAYIDKAQAIKISVSKLKIGIKNIETALTNQKKSSYFLQFIRLSKILEDILSLQRMVGVLNVLSYSNVEEMHSKMSMLESECEEKVESLKEQMKFSIDIENDFDDAISIALQETLESKGFVYETNGRLCIKGTFKTSMTENSAGVFVTPRLSIQIIDLKNGGKSLSSYSKTYQKWGHMNVEGAMKKAIFEVTKDLNLHFMEIFR
ncbi:MAG: hypothetical protein ACTTKH_08125, partial [Treponema sp.]